MPACPACQRPVAVARGRCLYCGAPLPPEAQLAAGIETPALAPEPSPPARSLVVVEPPPPDLGLERVAQALRCSAFEALQLVRRGGPHLHRILETAAAEVECARLRELGLAAELLPEAELALRPLPATGGERSPNGLLLRVGHETLEIRPGALLLIVSGPILRQRQASPDRRRLDTAGSNEGWRLHLHRGAETTAIEIDADNFEPGFAPRGSTRLELAHWLAELGEGIERDDRFRLQPPALAPAEPEPQGPLSALTRLRAPAAAAPSGPREPWPAGEGEALWLDNLRQFRFYSAWRGALERRRQKTPAAPPEAPPLNR
jgi:hypothetical protein